MKKLFFTQNLYSKRIIFVFSCILICALSMKAQNNNQKNDLTDNNLDSINLRMPVRPNPFRVEKGNYKEVVLFKSKEDEEEYYKNYDPIIIPEFFLLGTMNGYSYCKLSNDHINSYRATEKSLVNYLSSFVMEKLNIEINVKKEDEGLSVFSAELMDILDKYIINKELRDNIFNSDEKIYSFLLGSYYRYGGKNANNYTLFPSWLSIDRLFSLLIKNGGRDSVSYTWYKYSIPGSQAFIFQPSFAFEKYLLLIESEKSQLEEQIKSRQYKP